jgi:hypothetical protein
LLRLLQAIQIKFIVIQLLQLFTHRLTKTFPLGLERGKNQMGQDQVKESEEESQTLRITW